MSYVDRKLATCCRGETWLSPFSPITTRYSVIPRLSPSHFPYFFHDSIELGFLNVHLSPSPTARAFPSPLFVMYDSARLIGTLDPRTVTRITLLRGKLSEASRFSRAIAIAWKWRRANSERISRSRNRANKRSSKRQRQLLVYRCCKVEASKLMQLADALAAYVHERKQVKEERSRTSLE